MTRLEITLLLLLIIAVAVIAAQAALYQATQAYWRERWYQEYRNGYKTYGQLCKLRERVKGLAEIAAASHVGAQLYQSLLDELHRPTKETHNDEGHD
jgi:hypothetical protein